MTEFLGTYPFDSRILASVRSPVDPTMYRLLADVSAGIRVLQSRDGVALSETQIRERARNIVMGLAMNYRIERLEDEGEVSELEPAAHPFLGNASAPGPG